MTGRRHRKLLPATEATPALATTVVGLLGRPRKHTVVVWLVAIFMLTLTITAWPELTLVFSSAKPAVNALANDVLYVGPGAKAVDVAQIRGVIGSRSIAVIDLAATDPTAADPLGLCSRVTDRLDDILVMVIVDGEFSSGCQGSGLPIVGNRATFDIGFWLDIDRSTTFLDGDVALQTQQLALGYDSVVTGGTLKGETRTYRTPAAQLVLAIGIALAVVAAALLAFWGLRRSAVSLVHRRERRTAWRDRFDDLELQVSGVALQLVGPRTSLQVLDGPGVERAGRLAQQYLGVLHELENTRPEDDLSGLSDQVASLAASAGGQE